MLRERRRLLPVSLRRELRGRLPRRGQELPALLAALFLLGCSPSRSDCLDVYDLQVCYACGGAPCVGAAARRARGGRFRCAGDACEQAAPAMPDDGEWECVDLDGAVVCRGGIAPAGVVAGPADPGWRCGARRGSTDRICVDLAPDLPDGAARGWRCSFSHERGE